ncbi:L-carnitine dehydratase/bile acid-inducible protein F [Caballeronia choica]|uniref:L-carnitine dehydratase/bile acid-inducible protein F n=1 Tax=Caballeronia choica TaxID=326476 RepID=A0A158F6I6_9BURK|nr:CoA transferase [Caballeronia choica]SAL15321.1 L-carnitine dehydratase/bile acid-inducible protein F [Caballeronia choica]
MSHPTSSTSASPNSLMPDQKTLPGMLAGLRVIEVADELGEYCGLVLAGLGAEVIKVEPPKGSPTRKIGPFFEDEPGPERSLFYWAYNRGKKSVVVDTATADGREQFLDLLGHADILLDSSCGRLARELQLDQPLTERYPHLIVARITPFGDSGPWKDYRASDLIHLALGGVMMNCGYDPEPDGSYARPPIAPQVWHAYHIAGDQTAVAIVAALLHRKQTGEGQDLSCAVHQAVAINTELDLMSWVMRRAPLMRQTARHAAEATNSMLNISPTADNRWNMTWGVSARDKARLVPFLQHYDKAEDLRPPASDSDLSARDTPGSARLDKEAEHMLEVIQRFVASYDYAHLPWREAQDAGLLWAPVRKPHENAQDEHWLMRSTFSDIEHPELGRTFQYPTSKWLSTATAWRPGPRAPLLGEHNGDASLTRPLKDPATTGRIPAEPRTPVLSKHSKPFPLQGIRIFDFSWFLASAGGTRFLNSLGAESIKVEWKENPDTRLGAMAPVGGREARINATAPLQAVTDADMGGQFNNKNAGKRGMSLNIRHPKGLAIAKDLIRMSDIVAEGFSPGVLQRLGLGYDVLKSIRPDIIYVQQAGMGAIGKYGRFRTVGPVAASFVGSTEMSGLPDPAPPAGWGYSYLDWIGAYGFALAALGALYHREQTGEGQWIDSSQCESGIFQTATAVLDWSANGRAWSRYGNRSPYKAAAPHGAYRCAGDDRWLSIACFDDTQWRAFAEVTGLSALRSDPRFATLESRLANQDALDALVTAWSSTQDAYAGMERLQRAGVPAGVCQTAGDRCDSDPQLVSLEWLTEVTGTRIGRWPVAEFPVKMSATPAYSGGVIDRGAPCYGEDNEHILEHWLGFSKAQIEGLREEGVI